MKRINYLLVSVIIFLFAACASEENKSATSTADEFDVEETIVEEIIVEETIVEEVNDDWEPPGGRMDKYMDLKAEGYSHEEAVKMMEQDMK